jgi:hypothetical protein
MCEVHINGSSPAQLGSGIVVGEGRRDLHSNEAQRRTMIELSSGNEKAVKVVHFRTWLDRRYARPIW